MTDPNAAEQTTPNDESFAGGTVHQSDHADGLPEAPPSAPQWQPIGQQDGPSIGQPNHPPSGTAHGQAYGHAHDQSYSQPTGAPNPQYGQPNPQYGQPYSQYGQPHGQPYPTAYAQPYAAGPATNTLAIIALIAAFFFPPAGIVCGHIALGQIKTTGEAGRGLALAGVIIGYVWAALILLVIVLTVVLPLMMMGMFAPAFIGLGNM